jgi:hypothetical protein
MSTRRWLSLALFLSATLVSCSSHNMNIELRNGERGRVLIMDATDRALDLELEDGSRVQFDTSQIKRLEYLPERTLYGIGGAIVGTILGAAFPIGLPEMQSGFFHSDMRPVVGGMIGFVLGAFIGSTVAPAGPSYDMTKESDRERLLRSIRPAQ